MRLTSRLKRSRNCFNCKLSEACLHQMSKKHLEGIIDRAFDATTYMPNDMACTMWCATLRRALAKHSINILLIFMRSSAGQSPAGYYCVCGSVCLGWLPIELEGTMELVIDNRLSTSSWRTIESGLKHWRRVCTIHGWLRPWSGTHSTF